VFTQPGSEARVAWRGTTLIELVVALAVLSVSLAVAGLALRTLDAPRSASAFGALGAARERAIAEGVPIAVTVAGTQVRFEPDGSGRGGPVALDSLVLRIDPITGQVTDAAR
jgi:prepilin-type N-terminal cleavage/methylation domain-containing protein